MIVRDGSRERRAGWTSPGWLMHWNTEDLVQAVADGLRAAADAADMEQAVRGVDARDELSLHPLVRAALEAAGFGAWPEVRYPAARGEGRRNRGRRCDVVLTPERRPLQGDAGAGSDAPGLAEALLEPVALDNAYWMEVKTTTQFAESGPHRGYSQRLLQAASGDILKMADDPEMCHAGLLLVLFTRDETTARHDVAAWHLRCLQKEYPLGFPSVTGFTLSDRLGNGYTSVSLFPVR